MAQPYQTDGKNMTFQQYQKLKKQQEELRRLQAEELKGVTKDVRPGRCPECDGTSFRHRCEPGKFIRICKNDKCGDEQIV